MSSATVKRLLWKAGLELAFALAVCLVYFVAEKTFVQFYFKYPGAGIYRIAGTALSVIPVLAMYGILRVLLSRFTVAVVTSFAVVLLSYAHHVKFGLTGDPLSFTDISDTANASIISHYITPWQLAGGLLGILIGAMALYRFELPRVVIRLRRYRVPITILTTSLLVAVLCGRSIPDDVSWTASKALGQLGMEYRSYDWPENVRLNGVIAHLIQTSVRHMPDPPTTNEVAQFTKLVKPARADFERPKTVIMILCESCWNDDRHFGDIFSPLTERGMIPFRAISPVYGGGTVNAAFEMITGLPANGDILTGVIYQEYAPVMSDTAHTLPRYLDQEGYRTIALHNHTRRFWKRDIVAPKLGYDEFLGIEDMMPTPPVGWADDEYLYDAALKEMDEAPGHPLFMHLTTVYTHGSYERRGNSDLGEADYTERLRLSITRMADFIDAVYRKDPNTVLLVYGDHKPQLNAYFVKEGILPRSLFETVGDKDTDFKFAAGYSQELVGDMPIYVRSGDPRRSTDFVAQASGMPFFCVSKFFDMTFLKSSAPVYRFSGDICRSYPNGGYRHTVSAFPAWLYAEAILK